jgi:hypothetical protein
MGRAKKLAVALLVVGLSTVAGCDPRGGGDPRDAPGCDFGAYRCDGDVLQICQIDAAERRKTWWDVHDCGEFGDQIGKALACVMSAASPAECAEVVPDAGVEADAGYVVEDCPVSEWRCHEGVVQACDRGPQWRGTAWWDVWDCDEQSKELGRAMACVERGLAPNASTSPKMAGLAMATSEQRQVLATLLGILRAFTVAVREVAERGRLRDGGISSRAEVLYDSLLWSSGEEAVDFLESLPLRTRHAVEDLLDALLEDAPELDVLLRLRLPRGTMALARICDLIRMVVEVASKEFSLAGLDISDCDDLGETVDAAAKLLRAA